MDADPEASGDVLPPLYSAYMQAWWADPDDIPELADTEMATLFMSFRQSSVR